MRKSKKSVFESKNLLIDYAKREYGILDGIRKSARTGKSADELKALESSDKYGDMVRKSVMELLEVLSKQCNSELSSHYILSEFERLARFKSLSPLTGEDSEWEYSFTDCYGHVVEQNNRCFSVFRYDHDNSTAHNSEGKVFSTDGGRNWFSNSHSSVGITFPCEYPKPAERVLLSDEEYSKMIEEDERESVEFFESHPEYAKEHPEAKRMIDEMIENYRAKHKD